MDIPKWVLDPFSNTETIDSAKLEEKLIEVTSNEELKLKFKEGYQVFWQQKQIPILYPGLWAVVHTFLITFPSSYLVERGFRLHTHYAVARNAASRPVQRGLRVLKQEHKDADSAARKNEAKRSRKLYKTNI
ncbi:uncharacterized protein LOC132949116 [Metopolophium dirhodum]|uniref:uncharacterized protein LOC132949116 n=1 Tax=Metopolophium dirhodum TaxID=44670 RepID=UPI00298FA1B2|nr:uncharacterized protein LOC132949116 [Metopolophium dirhodum]